MNIKKCLVWDKFYLDQSLREKSLSLYKKDLIGDNIDELLFQSRHSDYCILTWECNIVNSNYFNLCEQYIQMLNEKTQNEWLVTGHIIDQYQNRIFHEDETYKKWENSFFLYPITSIVNINIWKSIGCPMWGKYGSEEIIIPNRSLENTHDTYTPITLQSSTQTIKANVKHSWNIINESLKNNYIVYNLNYNIRKSQKYMYPEVDENVYINYINSNVQ